MADEYVNIEDVEIDEGIDIFQLQPKYNSDEITIKFVGKCKVPFNPVIFATEEFPLSQALYTHDIMNQLMENNCMPILDLFINNNELDITNYYSFVFIPDGKYCNLKHNSYMTGRYAIVEEIDDTITILEEIDIVNDMNMIIEKLLLLVKKI